MTKDASMTTQGSEKENKRLLGKKGIKVVRISEEVQNSSLPKGKNPGALTGNGAGWQEVM
jgi:hypothetical protein